ncbi:MAG: NACHT domain-containing protein, partial [Myxococcales bacterium]|nr:NACHT domain-containing protein [Myxococcales bacterium]
MARGVLAALVASGLESPILVSVSEETLRRNVTILAPMFSGAQEIVSALRKQRLREVSNEFVEPDASIGGESGSVLAMLDAWLASGDQTALVLGEFGVGKSTVLAQWAYDRWERGKEPLPILVNLAGVGPTAAPEALLLQAAGLDDVPKHRAALRLLIRYGHIVPCFDGFDEMATRLEGSELAGRLAALLEVAAGGGKVLISSRTNYFPSKEHLRTAADTALVQALGESAGVRRIEIQPFSDEQVAALVRKIRTEEGAADKSLNRIAHIYDLRDLVHRPLLLGMV